MGMIARVRQAHKEGRKSILLTTAVDVYGAQNLIGQFPRYGFTASVRRSGKEVRLHINPDKPSTNPLRGGRNKRHTKMRNAIAKLMPGQCLVLTTPVEAHTIVGLRPVMKVQEDSVRLRTMRNGTSVMVWKV